MYSRNISICKNAVPLQKIVYMADWRHQKRIDLTSWVIHFVHERTPETSFEVLSNEMAEDAELNGCAVNNVSSMNSE